MNRYRSINIRLDQNELDALVAAAKNELRDPRDQARLILRDALLKPSQQKSESGANTVAKTPAAAL